MSGTIYYIGTEAEVSRHAAPLKVIDSSVKIAQPETVSSEAGLGDVAIFYSEHFDRFRDLCVKLKSKQVPTIYAIDGILEWRNAWDNRNDEIACPWTMRPCLADAVASIGPRQTAVLQSWGNKNVYTVGIPRLDGLSSAEHSLVGGESIATGNLTESKTIRILIVTAKWPGFTAEQIETTRQSLLAIKNQIANLKAETSSIDWQLEWRLTGGLEQDLQVNLVKGPIEDCIRSADIVVSTASTAMLESMLLHKPTVLLDFHQTPAYVPTVWSIHSEDQIIPVLKDVIRTSDNLEKIQFQQFLLHESLAADGHATQRLINLIAAMKKQASDIVENGLPWQFEGLQVDSLIEQSGYSNPMISPSLPNFGLEESTMSIDQLTAYAGQLKRENDRLNRLLTEAHQVFDHMQSHPVLGTILKTHKWVNQTLFNRPGKMEKPSEMEDNH